MKGKIKAENKFIKGERFDFLFLVCRFIILLGYLSPSIPFSLHLSLFHVPPKVLLSKNLFNWFLPKCIIWFPDFIYSIKEHLTIKLLWKGINRTILKIAVEEIVAKAPQRRKTSQVCLVRDTTLGSPRMPCFLLLLSSIGRQRWLRQLFFLVGMFFKCRVLHQTFVLYKWFQDWALLKAVGMFPSIRVHKHLLALHQPWPDQPINITIAYHLS